MLPGPDQIVACPHCGARARYLTLESGNTLGATIWSDGKQIAPMLPHPPVVVKCHSCAECFWLADATQAGAVDDDGPRDREIDLAWMSTPVVQEPTERQYYSAIRRGLGVNAEQQRMLRILAWWRRNDTFRDAPRRKKRGVPTDSPAWRANLEALAGLLDEAKEQERLMKAEVLRELGEFKSAQRVLGRVTSPRYAAIVRQLSSFCEARDTRVRALEFSG